MMPKSIWSYWATRYERLWAQHFALKPARNMVLEHLDRVLPQGPCRILDAGCGVGQLAGELAVRRCDWSIVASDTSAAMIHNAEGRHAHPNVKYMHGSIDDAARMGPFAAITTTNAFPYFPDKPAALRRMVQMLTPGGRLVMVHATIENPYDLLFMVFVRLTVSKAEYLSARRLLALLRQAGFTAGDLRPLRRAFFVPSIYLIEGIRG